MGLAHGMWMGTVAEGVEDIQTMAHLEALGCTTAQGYFIARPMPVRCASALPKPGSCRSGAAMACRLARW